MATHTGRRCFKMLPPLHNGVWQSWEAPPVCFGVWSGQHFPPAALSMRRCVRTKRRHRGPGDLWFFMALSSNHKWMFQHFMSGHLTAILTTTRRSPEAPTTSRPQTAVSLNGPYINNFCLYGSLCPSISLPTSPLHEHRRKVEDMKEVLVCGGTQGRCYMGG